jgi:3-oxoacyl-[acyl-carrier-protein] synthase-3
VSEVYVDHFAYALGEQSYELEESARSGRIFSRASDLAAAGFCRHHVCAPETTAYELARRCAEQLAPHLGCVDAIVYSTCLPLNANLGDAEAFSRTRDVKHLMDFPASRLQFELGLDRAFVVGVEQQACTGMLGALRLGRALVLAERDVSRVLCITADRFPEGAVYEQTYNLISDGAAACILSRAPASFRLLASAQLTNGALALPSDDEVVGSYFSYTRAVIDATLASAGLSMRDVTWLVPQNTNLHALRILARVLSLPENQVLTPTMAEIGHVISGDNVANLCHLVDSGNLAKGEILLLMMAGYGMNWQCALLEKL